MTGEVGVPNAAEKRGQGTQAPPVAQALSILAAYRGARNSEFIDAEEMGIRGQGEREQIFRRPSLVLARRAECFLAAAWNKKFFNLPRKKWDEMSDYLFPGE